MRVSNRLKTILQLIPSGSIVADIGCDHAVLLIQGIKENKIQHGYGIDIAQGPLNHAIENVKYHGLEDRISLILSNGLNNFSEKANVFVMAGMGTYTILDIIDNYKFEAHDLLIIQSNTKHKKLRVALNTRGFKIKDEVFIFDKKIPVCILSVTKGKQVLTKESGYLGPILQKTQNTDYKVYLENRYQHLLSIPSQSDEVKEEIEAIKLYLKG